MHIFDLYRRFLLLICAFYALVRTVNAIALLCNAGSANSTAGRLARSYLLTMLVSVQLRRFRRYLVQITLLLVWLALLVYAHGRVMEIW